jgi:hypothetical protein
MRSIMKNVANCVVYCIPPKRRDSHLQVQESGASPKGHRSQTLQFRAVLVYRGGSILFFRGGQLLVRPQNSVDRLNKAILAVGAAKSSKHLAHSIIWKYPEGHYFWAETASFRALTGFLQPGASSARRSKTRPHYAVVLPAYSARGSSTVNMVPGDAALLVSVSVPRCCWTIWRAMNRPSPAPGIPLSSVICPR